jgi:site-specific DNA-cytosine methylase
MAYFMKVLIACEFSGVVREAFKKRGHIAWSCDFESTEIKGNHLKQDVLKLDNNYNWDLMIAFPPCTHLCVSGARWFKDKIDLQKKAINFVQQLMNFDIKKIAIENPIGIISTKIRKPDQIIHPWQFGHGETKSTCLWLKNLPLLIPTNIVEGRESRIHKMSPGINRSKERSRTYQGIAEAMAEQWGNA